MAKPPVAPSTTGPDWEAVERDFRTGRFTLRELEAKHGVGYASISRKAKRDCWTKDLRSAIKHATKAKVIEKQIDLAQQKAVSTVVDAANVNSAVILKHQQQIRTAETLVFTLYEELAYVTQGVEKLEAAMEVIMADMSPLQMGPARQRFQDFLKLHNRVGSAQKLADTLVKLQTLERKAFGLDEEDESQQTDLAKQLGDFFGQLHQKGTGRLSFVPRVVGGQAA